MRGKPECVKALIRCGANAAATEGNGATALHGAAFHGAADVVALLLEAGLSPDQPDVHGHTPLSLARARGHESIVALLSSPDGNR